MSVEMWSLEDSGLWVCDGCDRITSEAHFYRNQMSGLMTHEADPARRKAAASRCGWSFDYEDGVGARRCALGHHPWSKEHNVKLHGLGRFTSTSRGARPPARTTDDPL